MTLFFREPALPVGDNEAEIACARLIQAREVDFIQNAMTECEPNAAVQIQSRANSRLCAGGPARCDSGPARSITNFVLHKRASSLPGVSEQFARRYGIVLAFGAINRQDASNQDASNVVYVG